MPVERRPRRQCKRREIPPRPETPQRQGKAPRPKIRIARRPGESGFRLNATRLRRSKELDILGRELEKAQLEYYPDPQKALREQFDRADINKKTAKIDSKRQELD